MYVFLLKLFADAGYQGPQFANAVAKRLPQLAVEIVKRSDQAKGFGVVKRILGVWLNPCGKLAKAHAFLHIMRGNPDNGQLSSDDVDVLVVLTALPERFVFGQDEETHALRKAKAFLRVSEYAGARDHYRLRKDLEPLVPLRALQSNLPSGNGRHWPLRDRRQSAR
jgi:hypothetical protein